MEKVKRMNQETKQSIHGMAEQLKVNLPEKDVSDGSVESQQLTEKAGTTVDVSFTFILMLVCGNCITHIFDNIIR
jgi:hypothetical protein